VEGISPDEGQPPAKPMGDDVIAIWSKQAQKIDNYNSPDFIRCNKDYYGGEPMADDFVLGSRVLRRGDAGSDVELTQNLLKVLPEPMGTQISMAEKGLFGQETEMAVKKFQKYFGLAVNGEVGKKTFLFLGIPTGSYLPSGASLFGARTLQRGSFGYDVWVLQNRLATTAKKFAQALGGPADKSFGSRTETAVKTFQQDVHLTADGVVGPKTFFQLYNFAGMGARKLQRNRGDRNRGYDVYWLQRSLKDQGYYEGKLDAIFGPLTEEAVKKLQTAVGIKVDGVVGAQTFYHLASF
jgi:peptidoglycan hydrolase-like protein with peptidoglycan-binding domain